MRLGEHYRVFLFYLTLMFIDYQIIKNTYSWIFSHEGMLVIFLFYVLKLLLLCLEPFVKFSAHLYQRFTHYEFHNLHYKLSLIGFVINVPRLALLIIFGIWILGLFNFSIFFIFMLIQLVVEMLQLVKGFRKMKELTKTMENLPKAAPQDLERVSDKTCMVCFREMEEGRILPCDHIFHTECLKQWIQKNTNHFCPKCKRPFDFNKPETQARPQAGVPGANPPHMDANFHAHLFDPVARNPLHRQMFLEPAFLNNIGAEVGAHRQDNNPVARMMREQTQNQTRIFKVQSEEQRIHRQEYQKEQMEQIEHHNEASRRIGSIAFCLPTEAVLFRRKRDFVARSQIRQFTSMLSTTLSYDKKIQMLLIPE